MAKLCPRCGRTRFAMRFEVTRVGQVADDGSIEREEYLENEHLRPDGQLNCVECGIVFPVKELHELSRRELEET